MKHFYNEKNSDKICFYQKNKNLFVGFFFAENLKHRIILSIKILNIGKNFFSHKKSRLMKLHTLQYSYSYKSLKNQIYYSMKL